MLPEHVALLHELRDSTNYRAKPILDEQCLEELNEVIYMSMEAKQAIKVTYFHEHDFKSIIGVIQHVDIVSKWMRIGNEKGSSVQIKLKSIIDVKSGY